MRPLISVKQNLEIEAEAVVSEYYMFLCGHLLF